MAEPKVRAVITAKNEATSALNSFKGSLIGILAVVGAAVIAFKALKSITDKVVEAASRQQDTEIKVAAALASVGENTAEARRELNDYLSTLEDVTTIGSDDIAKIAVQLIQLGGLTGTTLNAAIEVTLGLQAVTGRAANSISINIAKAAKGMVAGLSQYGVVVDKTLSKQAQFNDAMVQLNEIVGIGGKVLGLGFSGALRRIDNDLDNLNKAIGKSIVESEAFNLVLDFLSDAIQNLTKVAAENPEVLQSIIALTVTLTIGMAQLGAQIARTTSLLPVFIAAMQGTEAFGQLLLRRFQGNKTALEEFTEASETAFVKIGAALEDLAEKLAAAGSGTEDVADQIANVIAKIRTPLEELGDSFKKNIDELGVPSFDALEAKVALLNDTWAQLSRLQGVTAEGFSDQEIVFYQDHLVAVAAALEEAGFQFGFLIEVLAKTDEALEKQNENILSAQGFIEALSVDVVDLLEGQARAGALTFGDALIDAATGGEKAFKKFFQALLRDISRAIIQALVLKAITTAIGFFGLGGGIGPSGIPLSGTTVGLQRGGRVRGGDIGRDSVRALLKPGEVVLPETLAGDFSSIAAFADELRSGRGAPAGGGGFGNVTIPLTVVGGDDDSRLADLIERLSDAVTRSGYTLIASETTV